MNPAAGTSRAMHAAQRAWATLTRASAQRLLGMSVSTAACALLIHPWGDKPLSQPISFELWDGNVVAFLTLIGLGQVVLALGARFWREGNHLSAAACGVCIALLVVIPATDPRSAIHNQAYVGLVVIATGLFFVWALDTFDLTQLLPPVLPVLLGLPMYGALGTGGLQLLLIGSLLLALNLTYRHLETRGR